MKRQTFYICLLAVACIFQSCDPDSFKRKKEHRKAQSESRKAAKESAGMAAQELADSLLHKELIQVSRPGDDGFLIAGDTFYKEERRMTTILSELTLNDALIVSYNATFPGRTYSHQGARAELQIGKVAYKRVPSMDGSRYDSLYFFLPDLRRAALITYSGRQFLTIPATFSQCNGPACYIRKVLVFEIRDNQPQSYKVFETDVNMSGQEFGDYDKNGQLDFLIMRRNERPGTFEPDLKYYEMYPKSFNGSDWVLAEGLTRYLALRKLDTNVFCVSGGYWPVPLPQGASCSKSGI